MAFHPAGPRAPQCHDSKPEVITAALFYLLTVYGRRPCPLLAACIARHFARLAGHPGACRVVGDVAAAAVSHWEAAAQQGNRPGAAPVH